MKKLIYLILILHLILLVGRFINLLTSKAEAGLEEKIMKVNIVKVANRYIYKNIPVKIK